MKKKSTNRKWIPLIIGVLWLFPLSAWAAPGNEPASENADKKVMENTDAAKEPAAVPSGFVPESRFNFGQVVDGTEVLHDFVIQNKGTGDLKITSVRTG